MTISHVEMKISKSIKISRIRQNEHGNEIRESIKAKITNSLSKLRANSFHYIQ